MIPKFATLEEEAAFWDSHDTADYDSQFDPIKVRFAKPLSEGMTIRFNPQTLKRLRRQASSKGLGPTTLARMWILERLRRKETVSS
jgi:hypothetical protein